MVPTVEVPNDAVKPLLPIVYLGYYHRVFGVGTVMLAEPCVAVSVTLV